MTADLKGNRAEKTNSCPRCQSQDLWRHGKNNAGNQQFFCKSCGRVFVKNPWLSSDIKLIADRMLEEKIPVPKIAIILEGFVSRRWIYVRREGMRV